MLEYWNSGFTAHAFNKAFTAPWDNQVDQVIEISDRYPLAHGAPIHIGTPAEIGIPDINQPKWGDPAPVDDGHIPVFWACGVTPQVALENAKIPLAFTHAPGYMLVSDKLNTGLAVL